MSKKPQLVVVMSNDERSSANAKKSPRQPDNLLPIEAQLPHSPNLLRFFRELYPDLSELPVGPLALCIKPEHSERFDRAVQDDLAHQRSLKAGEDSKEAARRQKGTPTPSTVDTTSGLVDLIPEMNAKIIYLDGLIQPHERAKRGANPADWQFCKNVRDAALRAGVEYPMPPENMTETGLLIYVQRLKEAVEQHLRNDQREQPDANLSSDLRNRVASLERSANRKRPLSPQEKTRNQRVKFACPRRNKNPPLTWQAIYDAYHEKYPHDGKASPDTLRLAHDRNCPECRKKTDR